MQKKMDQRHAWVVFTLDLQSIKILTLAQVQPPLETSDQIRPMVRIGERRHRVHGDRCRHNGWALCSRSLPSRLPPRLALPEVPGTSFGMHAAGAKGRGVWERYFRYFKALTGGQGGEESNDSKKKDEGQKPYRQCCASPHDLRTVEKWMDE